MYKKPDIPLNSINWPEKNGCLNAEKIVYIHKGQHLDRFGSEYGFFLGLAGEPYTQRSLPWFGNYVPNNNVINNQIKTNFYDFYSQADITINPQYDYHLYKVLKPLKVFSCTIGPAFGFPGGGTQYRSDTKVKDLIVKGFIREVPWSNEPFFDDADANRIGGKLRIRKIKRKTRAKKYLNKKRKTLRKK